MTDPVPTPEHPTDEVYEAALVAHQSLGADVEWRDRTAFVVDAVWPLAFAVGVSEGRQQAAAAIRELHGELMIRTEDIVSHNQIQVGRRHGLRDAAERVKAVADEVGRSAGEGTE